MAVNFRSPTAHVLAPGDGEVIDVMGSTIAFLTLPELSDSTCVLFGMIPPHGFVPLHSHADPEMHIGVSGHGEGLVEIEGRLEWVALAPGDVFRVPGNAKHAFRNTGADPVTQIVVTTPRLGRFFREIGVAVSPQSDAVPPAMDRVRHFLETSERFGYWNASAAENSAVGLVIPSPASQ